MKKWMRFGRKSLDLTKRRRRRQSLIYMETWKSLRIGNEILEIRCSEATMNLQIGAHWWHIKPQQKSRIWTTRTKMMDNSSWKCLLREGGNNKSCKMLSRRLRISWKKISAPRIKVRRGIEYLGWGRRTIMLTSRCWARILFWQRDLNSILETKISSNQLTRS